MARVHCVLPRSAALPRAGSEASAGAWTSTGSRFLASTPGGKATFTATAWTASRRCSPRAPGGAGPRGRSGVSGEAGTDPAGGCKGPPDPPAASSPGETGPGVRLSQRHLESLGRPWTWTWTCAWSHPCTQGSPTASLPGAAAANLSSPADCWKPQGLVKGMCFPLTSVAGFSL